jgi:hypothetical protein
MIALEIRQTRTSGIPLIANVGASMANEVAMSPSSTSKLVIKKWNDESGLPVPW